MSSHDMRAWLILRPREVEAIIGTGNRFLVLFQDRKVPMKYIWEHRLKFDDFRFFVSPKVGVANFWVK